MIPGTGKAEGAYDPVDEFLEFLPSGCEGAFFLSGGWRRPRAARQMGQR